MAKPSQKVEVNSFVGGFVTEASPLNFPPNASVDEENFELKRDGTRQRRLGLVKEPVPPARPFGVVLSENTIFDTFEWRVVKDHPDLEILVVRAGSTITIHNANLPLEWSTRSTLGSYVMSDSLSNKQWGFANINGKLVVVADTYQVFVFEYSGTDLVLAGTHLLMTRDMWGVDSGISPSIRPTVLSKEHEYNLRNQGWGEARYFKEGNDYPFKGAIQGFYDFFSAYPSDQDILWTAAHTVSTSSGTPVEAMVPSEWNGNIQGNGEAPKGSRIISVLLRGSSRVTTGLLDETPGGPKVIKAFAGRIFYAGFNSEVIDGDSRSPGLSTYVFFSQLVRTDEDIAKAYQAGDPTSREYSDVVDTDGGFINIPDVGTIIALSHIGESLVVLSSEGVWAITGGGDYGFSATNYKVTKLSNFGIVGRKSLIEANNSLFYWSDNGINAITKNQYGDLEVISISETTIQTYYQNIDPEDKRKVIGVFDPYENKAIWFYGVNKELRFDMTLGAFYKYRFPCFEDSSEPWPQEGRIVGLFNTPSFEVNEFIEPVVVTTSPPYSDGVVVNGEEVAIRRSFRSSKKSTVKYLIATSRIEYASATLSSPDFKDLGRYDAKAYLLTGAVTGGASSIHKQVPYLTVHMRRTEKGVTNLDGDLIPLNQSSCWIRSQWDWANSPNSNKWSPKFQAYREKRAYFPANSSDPFDTGFEVVTSKNKLRGRGRAFSLYMETEEEKDCQILGWAIDMNGNSYT